jgi:hypothetical protein
MLGSEIFPGDWGKGNISENRAVIGVMLGIILTPFVLSTGAAAGAAAGPAALACTGGAFGDVGAQMGTQSATLASSGVATISLPTTGTVAQTETPTPEGTQTPDGGSGDEDVRSGVCDSELVDTIRNAMLVLTLIGPLLGGLVAGFNMVMASVKNDPQEKKQHSSNVQSSIFWGVAAGALFAILGVLSIIIPSAGCGF